MGREVKLLLALLATLTGVFLGVLSMKLLVPRPPAGAGPDVAVAVDATAPHDLVEPPSLSLPVSPAAPSEDTASWADDSAAPAVAASPIRDPFVTPAGLHVPAEPAGMPPPEPEAALPPAEPAALPAAGPAAPQVERQPPPPLEEPATLTYIAQPGDSWWNLAERAYGDGRLYRALFAWNRATNPRVSLAPGTSLELPQRSRLEAAWQKLMPAP